LPKKENNSALSKKVIILIKSGLLKVYEKRYGQAAYNEPDANLYKPTIFHSS